MCQPAGTSAAQLELLQLLQQLFATSIRTVSASAEAVVASAEAVVASAGAVRICAKAAAASARAIIGIFG